MPEMHLRQCRFTYSTCRPFTKNKNRIQMLKGTGDSRYIYQSELNKSYSQDNMIYEYFKDLTRRTTVDKVLLIKHLMFLKIPKIMYINVDLL